MKKHAIIPIFIPHRGCGHACVFCNQRLITARQPDVKPSDVRGILDTWLSTLRRQAGPGTIEAAFYGGSFTGLSLEEQASFLAVTKEYKDRGLIDRIHLSTRPDYINTPVLNQLRAFDVDIIELGVQSFDPEVLKLSRRGHTVDDIYDACRLIQDYGFTLGIQLMIGLPADSFEKCLDSARRTVAIGPSLARLYPTVVLADTELARMYRRGEYRPLTTDAAVAITKEMYRILDEAGITILRVGLKSTDLISADEDHSAAGTGTDGSAVLAHSYHPAFRQLVEGELARESLESQLQALLRKFDLPADAPLPRAGSPSAAPHPSVTFSSCGESFSNMVGHARANKQYFASRYPDITIRYTVDPALPRGIYKASIHPANTRA